MRCFRPFGRWPPASNSEPTFMTAPAYKLLALVTYRRSDTIVSFPKRRVKGIGSCFRIGRLGGLDVSGFIRHGLLSRARERCKRTLRGGKFVGGTVLHAVPQRQFEGYLVIDGKPHIFQRRGFGGLFLFAVLLLTFSGAQTVGPDRVNDFFYKLLAQISKIRFARCRK